MSEIIIDKRLEFTRDGSNKFWEMSQEQDGKIWCQWGKIGAKPQGDWYDSATAKKRYREKLAKGYEEKEIRLTKFAKADEVEITGNKNFLDDLQKI